MGASILDKIRQADNLPSLPAVAVQVLQLTRSDNASVPQIAKVIEHDPALTSKILKVANSSLFGMPRQISSLQQAMVVLGLRTVKVMALTFSLVDAMQGSDPGAFDYRSYWRNSLTSAVTARLLAEYVPACQADEIFVTALLSDIGMLAAFHADRDAYRQVLNKCARERLPLHAGEKQVFGATHENFSSLLLDTWGLPEKMSSAIAVHHHDAAFLAQQVAQDRNSTVGLLGAAVMVAEMFCSPAGASQLSSVRANVPKLVPIKDDQLQELLSTLDQKVQETASTWSIDIGNARSYKDVQAEAVVQLAKLTMAAELERAQLVVREKELHHENETLAKKASIDGLTGISNRLTLDEHLQNVSQSLREGQKVGMLMLDIDRFKKLNDTFGHQAGDTALRLVGEYLRRLASDRILAARYGGEEFALVIKNASADEVRRLAESVRLGIQQLRIPAKERPIGVTVSIGATTVSGGTAINPALLVGWVDKCLYTAKQTGRNRVIFAEFNPTAARPCAQRPTTAMHQPVHAAMG